MLQALSGAVEASTAGVADFLKGFDSFAFLWQRDIATEHAKFLAGSPKLEVRQSLLLCAVMLFNQSFFQVSGFRFHLSVRNCSPLVLEHRMDRRLNTVLVCISTVGDTPNSNKSIADCKYTTTAIRWWLCISLPSAHRFTHKWLCHQHGTLNFRCCSSA